MQFKSRQTSNGRASAIFLAIRIAAWSERLIISIMASVVLSGCKMRISYVRMIASQFYNADIFNLNFSRCPVEILSGLAL
jgi:hypothetical protein